jgi:hypothetical protein
MWTPGLGTPGLRTLRGARRARSRTPRAPAPARRRQATESAPRFTSVAPPFTSVAPPFTSVAPPCPAAIVMADRAECGHRAITSPGRSLPCVTAGRAVRGIGRGARRIQGAYGAPPVLDRRRGAALRGTYRRWDRRWHRRSLAFPLRDLDPDEYRTLSSVALRRWGYPLGDRSASRGTQGVSG